MKAYDIERYINGELEGEELQEFESLLSADSELRDEVNRTREVLDQLKQLSISERIRKAQQKNIEVKRWRIILFISILSLGILFLVFYIRSGSDEKTIGPSAESENQIPTSDSMLLENQNPTELPIDTEKIQVKEIPVAKKSEYREEPKYEEIAMNYRCRAWR